MLRATRVVHAGIDVELVRDDVGLKDVIQTLVLRNWHDLVLIAVVQLVRRGYCVPAPRSGPDRR